MQKISCFGYEATTKAIAKRFGPCIFYDDNVTKPFKDNDGNSLKPISEFNPRYSNLEIPSSKIPPDHPLIQKARHLKSEYDFFAPVMPYSIWVTGTDGKTTTTQMIQHLLKDRGSQVGGDKETPLANLDADSSIWILETNSFTLHYTHQAKPNIYIILPMKVDHFKLHEEFLAYEENALKPLSQMLEGEVILLPQKYANIPTAGFKILFDDTYDLAKYFGFNTENIKLQNTLLLYAVIAMGIDKILFDNSAYKKINQFKTAIDI